MSSIENFGKLVERSEIILGDHRKFWFQTANIGWSNVSNTKNNQKLTFLGKKRILMKEKHKTRNFRQMTLFLRGHRVRRGSCDQKKILLKFVQRSVLRTCEVWGASEKPFFGNLNTKPRGGAPCPPPVTGGPLTLI